VRGEVAAVLYDQKVNASGTRVQIRHHAEGFMVTCVDHGNETTRRLYGHAVLAAAWPDWCQGCKEDGLKRLKRRGGGQVGGVR